VNKINALDYNYSRANIQKKRKQIIQTKFMKSKEKNRSRNRSRDKDKSKNK
jgi:hypothetical protein